MSDTMRTMNMHERLKGNNTVLKNSSTNKIHSPDRSRGFTLIEVLVVLAILSILAGIVIVNVADRPGEARVAAARTTLQSLRSAVNLYRTDNGNVPTMQQGLAALVEKPTSGPALQKYPQDGYLGTRVLPADPWKNDYIYLVPGREGETFEIISYGSDGQPGGEGDAADLSSSEL